MKRKIGEIWKDNFLSYNSSYKGQWYIQFPYGIYNCNSKEDAEAWQNLILKDTSIPANKKVQKDTMRNRIMQKHFPELFE